MLAFQRCREELRTAPDEKAVRMLVTDCLSQVAGELGALPRDSMALIADRERDIHDIAVALLQAELAFSGDEATKKILWEVAHLFAGAATRIGHIRSRVHRQSS